ncbi:MAG: T9SS type A sorting domain-containing protein [Bacteroidales bacterium]|nr:T9SS type A sorting domain-containing protein [Bacteroidales bacterium]MBN2697868.1 T9SS type A sorting domain-containing protein [Bacteroidales bacterium]
MKNLITLTLLLLKGAILSAQLLLVEPPVRMLALGDSYTIGASVGESERWPVQFTEKLKSNGTEVERLDIIARTGWTTRNLKEAINASLDTSVAYNLVSLLIGVNNQYQGMDIALYETDFRYLLDKAIQIAGGDTGRVLVLSIPDYAFTPYGGGNETISSGIDQYNSINRQISMEYGVTYVDITGISRMGLDRPDYVASDGLHPSGIQYSRWVDNIMNFVYSPFTTFSESASESDGFIYPNPAVDYLIIEESSYTEVRVYDLNGRVVLFLPNFISPGFVYLDFLPAGFYILFLSNDKKRTFLKFQKK